MGAVQGTVDTARWLGVVEEVTRRTHKHERERMLLLKIDAQKGTLTLLDQEEDSVYAVTLPMRVSGTGQPISCRVSARKLEGVLQLFTKKRGEMMLTCRTTTLSCKQGEQHLLLPNYRVEPAVLPFRNVQQEGAVRFVVHDVEGLLTALATQMDAAVRVRAANGAVTMHTEVFATDSKRTLDSLWPREVVVHRLADWPEGVEMQVVVPAGGEVYMCGTSEGVTRELLFKPLPSTTLYISRPQTGTRPGEGQVWKNAALVSESTTSTERKRELQSEASVLESNGDASAADEEPLLTSLEIMPEPVEIEVEEPVDQKAALARLDQLPGLAPVKQQLRGIAQFAAFERERLTALGVEGKRPTLHMAFLGNPGTGKTMVARMLGRILKQLGLLSRGHVVEVDRQKLVGQYMGHTEANLANYVKRARGGILFIDEAYALYKKDSSKDFGLTAINGLVKVLEDDRDQLVVILAGYRREMQQFFSFNPGLRERIPFHVEFPDYTPEELVMIAERMAASDHYQLSDDAKEILVRAVLRERLDETFGNARTVRNLLEKAKIHHAVRAAGETERTPDAYTWLTAEDVQAAEGHAPETLDVVLAELERLVGLDEVKMWVRQVLDVLAMEQKRLEHGLTDQPLTFHMAFTGNPGTGKTTVARLIGRALRAMGVLPRGHYVEVSRKDLVAGYSGQTALKTAERVKEALGGVLFLDEAYALARKGRDEFGAEALATLIKEMEDQKGLMTVILAGYTNEMGELFRLNPGLKSRVRFQLHFPDYSPSDLLEIFKRKAEWEQYDLTPEAEEKLWGYFLRQSFEAQDDFGNGRLAERVFERAKINLSTRVGRMEGEVGKEALMMIQEEDVE